MPISPTIPAQISPTIPAQGGIPVDPMMLDDAPPAPLRDASASPGRNSRTPSVSSDRRGRVQVNRSAASGYLSALRNKDVAGVKSSLLFFALEAPLTDHQETALHLATKAGNPELVELVVTEMKKQGIGLDEQDLSGSTALGTAAEKGDLATVAVLVDAGASLQATAPEGGTAFHRAAVFGHIPVVEFLLTKMKQQHIGVDTPDVDGNTALHWAIEWTAGPAMVRKLLEAGADPQAKTDSGDTPLHLAASVENPEDIPAASVGNPDVDMPDVAMPHVEVVRILLNVEGIDVNAKDNEEKTPLHRAAMSNNDRIVTLLLDKGAALFAQDNDGSTPLHLAAAEGTLAAVETLLDYILPLDAAKIEAPDYLDRTPLGRAAKKGHARVVESLLECGATVDYPDGLASPLHHAAWAGQLPVVQRLVAVMKQQGLAIDRKDGEGKTALAVAASQGKGEIVTVLLNEGADLKAIDRRGATALHAAAACAGGYAAVELLSTKMVARRIGLDMRDIDGKTALHWAAGSGNADSVKALLDDGADLQARTYRGDMPLHEAARWRKPATVAVLLAEMQSRTNALDWMNDAGQTELHCAAYGGNVATVKLLLKHGADLHATTGTGLEAPTSSQQTAFWIATSEGHHELVNYLLDEITEGGSEDDRAEYLKNLVNVRDAADVTPLRAALRAGKLNVALSIVTKVGVDNVDLPEGDAPRRQILKMAAASGNQDITLALLVKMGRAEIGSTLDGALDDAIKQKDWGMLVDLLPLITNNKDHGDTLLSLAFSVGTSGGLLLDIDKTHFVEAVGRTIVASEKQGRFNQIFPEPLEATKENEAANERLFYDIAPNPIEQNKLIKNIAATVFGADIDGSFEWEKSPQFQNLFGYLKESKSPTATFIKAQAMHLVRMQARARVETDEQGKIVVPVLSEAGSIVASGEEVPLSIDEEAFRQSRPGKQQILAALDPRYDAILEKNYKREETT
jgi:ankyrin repeat protein